MELNIDAMVYSTDGPVGPLKYVILDEDTHTVRGLVVDLSRVPAWSVVVPVDMVAHSDRDRIQVRCTTDQLRRFPPYTEAEYYPPRPETPPNVPFAYEAVRFPRPAEPIRGVYRTYEVPGALTIAEGLAVECEDGACGQVDEVLTDPFTDRVTSFIVKGQGGPVARRTVVPTTFVTEVTPARVRLSLTQGEFEQLQAA